MEFRLVVRGALPPGRSSSLDLKHRIRRELHPQLRALWLQHPALKDQWSSPRGVPTVENRANNFALGAFRFVPLVANDVRQTCALDIVLLRRDEPMSVFNAAGDIDGRAKTLLDGLRMPRQSGEIKEITPEAGEDPFFVLLEDDRLVYELNVTMDYLWVPPDESEPYRDVLALIRVRTRSISGSVGDSFYDSVF